MRTDDDPPSERDEALIAHLERGWDLLEKNDLARAEVSAREILKIDRESPEASVLLGAIARAKGDTDEALEHYRRASELDPDFVDPLLWAADLHLGPDGDLDEAIALCDRALDLAEEEVEYIDALLLKAEAQVQAGDLDDARATLAELPPADLPEPGFHQRAGSLLLDLGDLDAAEAHLQRVLRAVPDSIDAIHALAMIKEDRGHEKAMIKLYLKVREADLKAEPPPWGVSRERFEAIAEEALATLPEKIRKLLENVPVIVADYPAAELVSEGYDPRMLGFFSGVPYPDKSTITPPHLDAVFLYQRNIERIGRTTAEVEEEIKKTVLHETGHFFGLSEEELEAMGLG